jgi:hypothetical protein
LDFKIEPYGAWQIPIAWIHSLRRLHALHELRLKTRTTSYMSRLPDWLVGSSLNRLVVWGGKGTAHESIILWERISGWQINSDSDRFHGDQGYGSDNESDQSENDENYEAERQARQWMRRDDEDAESYKSLFYCESSELTL